MACLPISVTCCENPIQAPVRTPQLHLHSLPTKTASGSVMHCRMERIYRKIVAGAGFVFAVGGLASAQTGSPSGAAIWPGVTYTNSRVATIPRSIHLVRIERTNSLYQIQSAHAGANAIGLETLSEQIARVSSSSATPVAGINGDFYQRERAYAGAPRGLQIVNGELLSGPSGG